MIILLVNTLYIIYSTNIICPTKSTLSNGNEPILRNDNVGNNKNKNIINKNLIFKH